MAEQGVNVQEPKAQVDLTAIASQLSYDFGILRDLACGNGTHPVEPEVARALDSIEAFCSVAMRVIRTTNPSKLRSAAQTEEIKDRIKRLSNG